MKNIISFSGGKDSTAMLLMLLERHEPIHSVVFFDTGWEFPEILQHIDAVEMYTGIEIVRLKPAESFTYMLQETPVIARKGPQKGQIHRYGYGWPSAMRRWCTRLKIEALSKYMRRQRDFVSCIGFAADEAKRVPVKHSQAWPERYPLIESNISGDEALKYCRDNGFSWGGLYDIFDRVSCFCCPLQRIGELRNLRKHRPELWNRMLSMQPSDDRGFRGWETVADLDRRFAREDRQLDLFETPMPNLGGK